MNATDTTTAQGVDISRFCSKDDSRKAITTPWSEGDHSYASDGKTIVRVTRLVTIPERPDAPKGIDEALFVERPVDVFIETPIPEISDADAKDSLIQCRKCDGTGDCPCCGSFGECPDCYGKGYLGSDPVPRRVGDSYFNPIFLKRIKDLPGVRFFVNGTDGNGMAKFEFFGGDGRIMPIKIDGLRRRELEKAEKQNAMEGKPS